MKGLKILVFLTAIVLAAGGLSTAQMEPALEVNQIIQEMNPPVMGNGAGGGTKEAEDTTAAEEKSAPAVEAKEAVEKKAPGKAGSTATAVLKGAQPDSAIAGTVQFEEVDGGLKVTAEVSGVPAPGQLGFHIHENGSCDEQGKAAGGHYNPHGAQHGFLPNDGSDKAHAGDMGNITVDENGTGALELIMPGLSILGENNVAGRSVILHEKADDFGQPTGNAGGRIGCGIIQVPARSPGEV